MIDERTFPIQNERGAAAHPSRIPWSVGERAYNAYVARWGHGQTMQRLAERGGFAPSEMDVFLPGWREEVSEIASLREEVARLTEERDEARAATNENHNAYVMAFNRVQAVESALASSRALADRLAAAMRLVLSWTPEDPHGGLASDLAFARAALREWEEARRG